MPDLESNFLIAITGMTVICILLIGVPIVLMLGKTFRLRRDASTTITS
jgi:hypothetical protein